MIPGASSWCQDVPRNLEDREVLQLHGGASSLHFPTVLAKTREVLQLHGGVPSLHFSTVLAKTREVLQRLGVSITQGGR